MLFCWTKTAKKAIIRAYLKGKTMSFPDLANFHQTFLWVIAHGYVLIFLVMCAEGPVTTAAAGFASALGYFNPWIILVLSISGDLVPDSLYYMVGYFGRFAFIEKLGLRLHLTETRVGRMEDRLEKNFGKTMVALKVTPVIPTFGFMLIGYLKLSFIRFTEYSALVTVPKSIMFLAIGYYFGRLYDINRYLHYAGIFFPVAVLVALLVYLGYKKIAAIVAKKAGKI